MRKCLLTCIAGCLLVPGCGGNYSQRGYWEDADIRVDWHPALPGPGVSVVAGEYIVLQVTDGWSRGLFDFSTAHSSSETFLIRIPLSAASGDVFDVSSDDGSLGYEAFWGYSSKMLAPGTDCSGRVHVVERTGRRVTADLSIRVFVLADDYQRRSPDATPFERSFDGVVTCYPRQQYLTSLQSESSETAGESWTPTTTLPASVEPVLRAYPDLAAHGSVWVTDVGSDATRFYWPDLRLVASLYHTEAQPRVVFDYDVPPIHVPGFWGATDTEIDVRMRHTRRVDALTMAFVEVRASKDPCACELAERLADAIWREPEILLFRDVEGRPIRASISRRPAPLPAWSLNAFKTLDPIRISGPAKCVPNKRTGSSAHAVEITLDAIAVDRLPLTAVELRRSPTLHEALYGLEYGPLSDE